MILQCVWPLATHTAEQIYGIHDPSADKKKRSKDLPKRRDSQGNSGTESEKNDTSTKDCDSDNQENKDINTQPSSQPDLSTRQDSQDGMVAKLDKNDTKVKDCENEKPVQEDTISQPSEPSNTATQIQTPEEPRFLRPCSTGLSQKQSSEKELFDGRITPPPPIVSPLPATPAGSMTPVCIRI